MSSFEGVFAELGLQVLERGWLSANNIVFRDGATGEFTVVDTGYDCHSAQTVALLEAVAGGAGITRVLNTHLHSDHCGGNRAIQDRWDADVWVPEVSLDAVTAWDQSRLTYELTGQTCRRFRASRGLAVGESMRLGSRDWEVLRAPGHDPESIMLFQRDARVLISADALWESRLAIIFPELAGASGFAETAEVLDTIEALEPRVVIPGHGRPFGDVAKALAYSRQRLASFVQAPARHARAAARALAMFYMLEQRKASRAEFEEWLSRAPIFAQKHQAVPDASALVDSLLADGLLDASEDGWLVAR